MQLQTSLRIVEDFPKKGIKFRDITSWFECPEGCQVISNLLREQFLHENVDKVVAIESRGFIGASLLSNNLGKPLILARKPGKLPVATVSEAYTKEYGTDSIEIAVDSIKEGDMVVIHDDLLATGGTALAVCNLVKGFKPSKIVFSCLIEIKDEGCNGRELLESAGIEVRSLLID